MYAISSAGLTHALAKACSAGRMERCTCDEAPDLENRKAWQWGGCGDNLKYANKFVKDFLGKRSNKDLRARVDMHNTNVGMKVRVRRAFSHYRHSMSLCRFFWSTATLFCLGGQKNQTISYGHVISVGPVRSTSSWHQWFSMPMDGQTTRLINCISIPLVGKWCKQDVLGCLDR